MPIRNEHLTDKYKWEIDEKTDGYRLIPFTWPKVPGRIYYRYYELPPKYQAMIKVREEDMLF